MTARRTVVEELASAASRVESGMTVAIGGLGTSSHPMALIREVIRNGIEELRVVAGPMASLEVDLMIAAGCVAEVVSSYVGGERLAPIGPAYRRAIELRQVRVREVDEGIYCQALGAAARMLPFATWRGGIGTDLPKFNDQLVEIGDPFGGPPVLAVKALPIDVALIHADAADSYGNVQPHGTGFGDRLHAAAADITVVQVERLISNEEVRRAPWLTSMPDADAIVRAPFGAHPYSSPGHYVEDEEHLREYVAAATAGGPTLDRYINQIVREPSDHVDYCARIGLRRLLQLGEYV